MSKLSRRPVTVAGYVVAKLGGARVVARILGCDPSTVYRRTYSPDNPSCLGGGRVPPEWHDPLLAYAEAEAIALEPADLVRIPPDVATAEPVGDAGDEEAA